MSDRAHLAVLRDGCVLQEHTVYAATPRSPGVARGWLPGGGLLPGESFAEGAARRRPNGSAQPYGVSYSAPTSCVESNPSACPRRLQPFGSNHTDTVRAPLFVDEGQRRCRLRSPLHVQRHLDPTLLAQAGRLGADEQGALVLAQHIIAPLLFLGIKAVSLLLEIEGFQLRRFLYAQMAPCHFRECLIVERSELI